MCNVYIYAVTYMPDVTQFWGQISAVPAAVSWNNSRKSSHSRRVLSE